MLGPYLIGGSFHHLTSRLADFSTDKPIHMLDPKSGAHVPVLDPCWAKIGSKPGIGSIAGETADWYWRTSPTQDYLGRH